jgi:hypothetical protein
LKIRRSLAILGAGATVAIAAGVVPGALADTGEAGACTVTGSVGSSGIGLTPSGNTYTFNSVTISCTSNGDDTGNYTVNVVPGTGTTSNETCAAATNITGSLTGSGPEGSLTGSLDSSTSHRAGANVIVNGTINSGGEAHSFHGHLIFQPTNGVCAGGSGNTTAANIITGSSAVVTE